MAPLIMHTYTSGTQNDFSWHVANLFLIVIYLSYHILGKKKNITSTKPEFLWAFLLRAKQFLKREKGVYSEFRKIQHNTTGSTRMWKQL